MPLSRFFTEDACFCKLLDPRTRHLNLFLGILDKPVLLARAAERADSLIRQADTGYTFVHLDGTVQFMSVVIW